MPYDPQVVNANVVSDNKKNGLFEVVVVLKDRTQCRLTFERNSETGTPKISNINRLLKEPCPICRKDFLCNCMERYAPTMSEQALSMLKL